MSDDIARQQAMILFERAHRHHLKGEFADAILLYHRSIAVQPTGEAFTYLGWTYSMMSRYEEAIESCKQAIECDPNYGNPYNDIGKYLIKTNRWEEAVTWLEQAIDASRYDSPHLPNLQLGQVHQHMGRFLTALKFYDRSLEIDPFYLKAVAAKRLLLGRLN